MDNQQWQVAKKVAATYIGTVVELDLLMDEKWNFFTVNGFCNYCIVYNITQRDITHVLPIMMILLSDLLLLIFSRYNPY